MVKTKALRLGIFSLVALLAALIAVDVGLAWVYVSALTQPGCSAPINLEEIDLPEEHWLTTEDGLLLRAWYYPSKNGAAVLALGGIGGSLGDVLPPVRPLIEAGYGVLQIDSRACARPHARVTLGAYEIHDAAAGIAFLLTRPDIDPEKIGAIGFSMGGVTIIRAAALRQSSGQARQPQIKALVAEGGYDQLGKHIIQPDAGHSLPRKIFLYTVAGVFWVQIGVNPWEISPLDDIAKISPRPVFLIYGEHELERGGGKAQFDAAEEPKLLWVVPRGDHGGNYQVAKEEYERRIVEFFKQALFP
ncbi:MAG: hypothetical protein ISR58_11665 [Anaerolineales bacterium]|nr:hypothetical protein [Chloroflexota bacterium]MBL6981833.1 hypothetical protein [Anaerolineales bacterium]